MNPTSSLSSGYGLKTLRVTYISKVHRALEGTIEKLRKSLAWTGNQVAHELPLPQRLQRRAWRVWYNKAPHAIGWSKRHYIFHDWRYAFTFADVTDPRYDKICTYSISLVKENNECITR